MQGCVMYYKHKLYSRVWQSTFCMLKVHNALTYRTTFPLFQSHLKGQVTQRWTFSHQLLTLMLLQIHMDFFYNLFMNLKCQNLGGMEISLLLKISWFVFGRSTKVWWVWKAMRGSNLWCWVNKLSKGIGTLCILGYNFSNLKFKSDKTLKSVE